MGDVASTIDTVANVAGWQQPPRHGAAGVEEIETDARTCSSHAGDRVGPVDPCHAVAHLEAGMDQLARIRLMDADQYLPVAGADQPLVDGEGADGR
jgi:hypothetical protein